MSSRSEVLCPPSSGAGTLSADTGEITPVDPATFYKEPGYSPYPGRSYPERLYFGDQHVHTSWSVDAGGTGRSLGPEEATRFARGEEVTTTSGQPAKLGQPLDWIAVTNHSDAMGVITEIKSGNPEMMADSTIKRWHDMFLGGPAEAKKGVLEPIAAQANKTSKVACWCRPEATWISGSATARTRGGSAAGCPSRRSCRSVA